MSSSLSPPSRSRLTPGLSDEGRGDLGVGSILKGRNMTREGKQPKKRGPKPDSRPAMNRRQELNRQAQRTHRERKEQYIKSLEEEVLRLKGICSSGSRAHDQLADENRQLRAQLQQNGIIPIVSDHESASNTNSWFTSSGSEGYATGLSPRGPLGRTPSPFASGSGLSPSQGSSEPMSGSLSPGFQYQSGPGQNQSYSYPQHQLPLSPPVTSNLDYDQVGIEFVLALEKPCMKHLPFLLERARNTGTAINGHTLMATCPPEPAEQFPFLRDAPDSPPAGPPGSGRGGDAGTGHWTQGLTKADLPNLLNFSKDLDLNGEMTPVMAWGAVSTHPRLGELQPDDFKKLADELKGKIRCYGFGAVLEEFEVRDAIAVIFASIDEPIPTAF